MTDVILEDCQISPLLSAEQVGEILGVDKRRVLRMDIKQVRFGPRTLRYRLKDVQAFIEENQPDN
jgi:hypothetical protein